jgi:N-glycosylase/DNA lyase
MSECNKSWSDLQSMIEQSNLEKNLQNKLRIEDLKIVVGQLESQELPVYYSVLSRLWKALSFYLNEQLI